MIKLKKILNEVRYVNGDIWNTKGKENPLKDSETIRVYHGFNSLEDAYYVAKYGLSGKARVGRIYSYESGNNPTGLFVTIMFSLISRFAHSGVAIEFTSKVSDLEAPVWVGGGSYFVQGQYAPSFENPEEREIQKLKNREKYSSHEMDAVSKSDRPELGQTIFDNSERQALFVGDLNPNMIKYFWVNLSLMRDRLTGGKWIRLTREQFLKYFDVESIKILSNVIGGKPEKSFSSKYSDKVNKIFNPNDNFTMEALRKYFEKHKYGIDDFMKYYLIPQRDLHIFFYPKQLKQIDDLIKSGKLL